MRSIFTTLILVAATSAAALADPAPKPAALTAAHTDDCARARAQHKTCVIDIGSEDIVDQIPKNDGERFEAIKFNKAGSLIRLRTDFIAQIVKTADDL